jgi:hypothetical protein
MTDTDTTTRLAEWAAVAGATLPEEVADATEGEADGDAADPWTVDGGRR